MDKILDFILIIICIIFNALIFILSKDYNIKITIITFIFTIAILVLFYLKKRNFTRYMNDILVKLSDMLSTISDMREEEVLSFPSAIHFIVLISSFVSESKILYTLHFLVSASSLISEPWI